MHNHINNIHIQNDIHIHSNEKKKKTVFDLQIGLASLKSSVCAIGLLASVLVCRSSFFLYFAAKQIEFDEINKKERGKNLLLFYLFTAH